MLHVWYHLSVLFIHIILLFIRSSVAHIKLNIADLGAEINRKQWKTADKTSVVSFRSTIQQLQSKPPDE